MSVPSVMAFVAVLLAIAEIAMNGWNTLTVRFIALIFIIVKIELKIIMVMIVVMTIMSVIFMLAIMVAT